MQAELGYTKHIGGADATRELLELCKVEKHKIVLNVGCGAGTTTTFIVDNYGCYVVAVDIKENMIESAQHWAERKGITEKTEFRVADTQQLPFEDHFFDILISDSVNVFLPDKARAFSEYNRVIQPGGVVGINEAILTKTPPENAADLLADYVGNEILPGSYWRELLANSGFTDLVSREYEVEMRKESRSQLGFFSTGDYLGLLGNMLKVTFGRDPFYAQPGRKVLVKPPGFLRFLWIRLVCWVEKLITCTSLIQYFPLHNSSMIEV